MDKMKLQSKWRANPLLRYFVVGTWNTLFSIFLLYALFFFFNNRYYEYELGITFVVSTGQSYITQRFVVWKSSSSPKAEFLRFFTGTIVSYIINSVSLYIFVHSFNFKPSHVALPLLLVITCGFYFVNRNIVFKVKSDKKRLT